MHRRPEHKTLRSRVAHRALLPAAAVLTGVLAGLLGHRALTLVTGVVSGPTAAGWSAPGLVRVEDVVALGAALLGAVIAAWFCLALAVATGCAAARSTGRAWMLGERLVARAAPGIVRRALVLSAGTGVALAGAALPATAGVDPQPSGDLGWSVTSEEPAAPAPAAPAAPPPVAPPPEPPGPAVPEPPAPAGTAPAGTTELAASGVVTVAPGDTLWDIAREHLPAAATPADIATAWPAWYAANDDVIGTDPDLILPGQRLAAPTGDAVEGAHR